MADERNDQHRSTLSVAVGERLRERRTERGLSLREVAATAAISPGHLSEIENGRSHASLPVLFRVGRILHYPLAEMLPRIVGHRVLAAALPVDTLGSSDLSHGALKLNITALTLQAGDVHEQDIGHDQDVFVFVVDGTIALTVADVTYQLAVRDAADIEKAHTISIDTDSDALVLLAICPRD